MEEITRLEDKLNALEKHTATKASQSALDKVVSDMNFKADSMTVKRDMIRINTDIEGHNHSINDCNGKIDANIKEIEQLK